MESNKNDNRSQRSNRQADRANQNQSRSNRVEFANEFDMDKKSDRSSEKANKN